MKKRSFLREVASVADHLMDGFDNPFKQQGQRSDNTRMIDEI